MAKRTAIYTAAAGSSSSTSSSSASSSSTGDNPSSSNSITTPTVYRVFDRHLSSSAIPTDASLYSMLRAWVQDDPLRQPPWYFHVKKEGREGGRAPHTSSPSSLYFSSSMVEGGQEVGEMGGFFLPPPLPETAMTLLKEGSAATAAPPLSPSPSPAPLATGTAAINATPTTSSRTMNRDRNSAPASAAPTAPAAAPAPPAPAPAPPAPPAPPAAGLVIDGLRHVPTEILLDLHVGFFRQVRKGLVKMRERRVGRFKHRLALLGLMGGERKRTRGRAEMVVEERKQE